MAQAEPPPAPAAPSIDIHIDLSGLAALIWQWLLDHFEEVATAALTWFVQHAPDVGCAIWTPLWSTLSDGMRRSAMAVWDATWSSSANIITRLGALKLVAFLVGLVSVALFVAVPAHAEPPGHSATATAHALDELANCRAQRRPECPTPRPTSTSTPTATTVPTHTLTPVPMVLPEPTVEPTAEPCWLQDELLGDPDSGYIVFDADGAPVPCSTETPTPEPEPEPTATPEPTGTPTPRSSARTLAPAPAPPQVQVVERTVVVEVVITVTPQEMDPTRAPTSTPTLSPTRTPSATRTPTSSATPTRASTSTPTAAATADLLAVGPTRPAQSSGRWDWGMFAIVLATVLAVVIGAALVFARRQVAEWAGRS